jgi:hypothetical protein
VGPGEPIGEAAGHYGSNEDEDSALLLLEEEVMVRLLVLKAVTQPKEVREQL